CRLRIAPRRTEIRGPRTNTNHRGVPSLLNPAGCSTRLALNHTGRLFLRLDRCPSLRLCLTQCGSGCLAKVGRTRLGTRSPGRYLELGAPNLVFEGRSRLTRFYSGLMPPHQTG